MRPRLATLAFFLCLPLAAKTPLQDVQVTTTDRVDFAPGGTIQISGQIGELDVQGWDTAAVEITVTKSTWSGDTSKGKDQGAEILKRVQVKTEKKGSGELGIVTTFPSRNLLVRPLLGRTDVTMQYVIRVPRNSHVVVHQGTGDLRLEGLTGAIDATLKNGDIQLWRAEANTDSIDAKCGVGGVSSDFAGTHRGHHAVGETYDHDAPAPAPPVHLRVGVGGIQILKSITEVAAP